MKKVLFILRFCYYGALIILVAISLISGSSVNETVEFFPSFLRVPDGPQYVPSITEVEVFNPSHSLRQIFVHGYSCNWLTATFDSDTVEPEGSTVMSIMVSPVLGVGAHNCTIDLLDGFTVRNYLVQKSVTKNQYEVHSYEFSGSRLDILAHPSRYSFEIDLYNPFGNSLSIYEVSTDSDLVNVRLNNDQEPDTPGFISDSPVSIQCSISAPRPIPGVYREFISIQTVYDKVVVPIILHQTVDSFQFVDPIIDFGFISLRGEKLSRDIILAYSGMDNLLIKSVTLRHVSPFFQLHVHEPPRSIGKNRTILATISFKAAMSGTFDGSVVVETEAESGSFTKELRYVARVAFESHIVHLQNAVLRLKTRIKFQKYELYLPMGTFSIPLDDDQFIIEEAQLTTCNHFMRIRHSLSWRRSVLHVDILRDVSIDEIEVSGRTCWVELASNTSFHKLPLHVSSGRVEVDAFQGTLIDHHSFTGRENSRGRLFQDHFDVGINKVSQMEPRDIKFVLTNNNPSDESVTHISGAGDACLCVVGYVPVGANSLNRCAKEMNLASMVDYRYLQQFSSSHCTCTNSESFPNFGLELRSGFHTIVSVIYDRLRPTLPSSKLYRNASISGKIATHLQVFTSWQEIIFRIEYQPLSQTIQFDCVDSFFCNIFPIGMRHVNIRSLVPISDSSSTRAQVYFDTMSPILSLHTRFDGIKKNRNVFDTHVSLILNYQNSSLLLSRSMWFIALNIAQEAGIDTSNAREVLDSIGRKCVDAEGGILFSRLYDELSRLSTTISSWYESGLRFASSGLIVSSQSSLKTHVINNPLAILPQQILPVGYEMDVMVGCGRVSFIYLEFLNPFEVPVTVAIVTNHSMGFIKLQQEPIFPSWTSIGIDRRIPIHSVVGENGMTEALLVSGGVLETFEEAKFPKFVRPDGANMDPGESIGNLIRFPQKQWAVESKQRVILGPIEIASGNANNSAQFVALLFNSFSGFDKLVINLNNSVTKVVVGDILECKQDTSVLDFDQCRWESVLPRLTYVNNKTIRIPFRRLHNPFVYKVILHNIGTSMQVNHMSIGDIVCIGQIEHRPLLIDHLFKRRNVGSVCDRIPFDLPQNQTLELDIVVQELNVLKSFPMHLSLRELPYSSGSGPFFDAMFVFEEVHYSNMFSSSDQYSYWALFLRLLIAVGSIGFILFLDKLWLRQKEGSNRTTMTKLDDIIREDAIDELFPVVSRKVEGLALEHLGYERSDQRLSIRLKEQKESILTELSLNSPASATSSNYAVNIPNSDKAEMIDIQTASIRKRNTLSPVKYLETKKRNSLLSESAANSTYSTEELQPKVSEQSQEETIVLETLPITRDSKAEISVYEPSKTTEFAKPPGLIQHFNRANEEAEFVASSKSEIVEVDDEVFQYQGQLLGSDDDKDLQFDTGPFAITDENKFLSSLSHFGLQRSFPELSLSHQLNFSLDFERDYDLSAQINLFDTEVSGMFNDEPSDLFAQSTNMNFMFSFLNEPGIELPESNPLIVKGLPLELVTNESRWLGMNTTGIADNQNFFGPDQFFSFDQGENFEELEDS